MLRQLALLIILSLASLTVSSGAIVTGATPTLQGFCLFLSPQLQHPELRIDQHREALAKSVVLEVGDLSDQEILIRHYQYYRGVGVGMVIMLQEQDQASEYQKNCVL